MEINREKKIAYWCWPSICVRGQHYFAIWSIFNVNSHWTDIVANLLAKRMHICTSARTHIILRSMHKCVRRCILRNKTHAFCFGLDYNGIFLRIWIAALKPLNCKASARISVIFFFFCTWNVFYKSGQLNRQQIICCFLLIYYVERRNTWHTIKRETQCSKIYWWIAKYSYGQQYTHLVHNNGFVWQVSFFFFFWFEQHS